jgi:phosphohistidine phosphatase
MKQLILIRHAKSSWAEPDQKDFERPLNTRGEHDAPRMGRALAEHGIRPDKILASPARRAISTARILAQESGFKAKHIEEIPAIYEASPDTLLQLIRQQQDDAGSIALVGHNPGLTMLANRLGDRFIDNIPTCGMVVLQVNGPWAGVGGETLPVSDFLYPKMLK